MSKLTTEEFIIKSKALHNDKYTYTSTVYNKSLLPVTITCRKHGDFSLKPNYHLNGTGCPDCSTKAKRLTTKSFITRARSIHGDTFEYGATVFKHSKKKLTVTCKLHGDIEITPDSHLRGGGCRKCADEASRVRILWTTKDFIDKSSLMHNGYYNYSKTIYNGANNKVTIICPVHGEFKQIAFTHYSGGGCVGCISSNRLYTKFPTSVYYIKIEKNDVTKYKVGITTKKIQERFSQEIRNGYDIDVKLLKKFNTGRPAFMLEQAVLKNVAYKRHDGYRFLWRGVGDTELFDFPLTCEESAVFFDSAFHDSLMKNYVLIENIRKTREYDI